MPRPRLRDAQADFRGGLNVAADDDALAPNEIRRADEAVLDEFGAIKKRPGTQRLQDNPLRYDRLLLEGGDLVLLEDNSGIVLETFPAQPVQNGFAWLRDNGTQQLLAVCNGKLLRATYGVPTSFTEVFGSMKTTGAPAFASFRTTTSEVVYIADGDTATSLNRWDGSTLTANIASTPAGITQLAVYNQRLFGCTGADQKIWWSAINNGDTLGVTASGGGEAIVRTFSDQNITGLAAFGSSLLIFHVSGISRFTGLTQDDIAIAAGAQGLSSDVGAISGRSIVTTPQGVYFLSDRGFYVASEGGVQPISVKLDPIIRSLNLATASQTVGVHRRALREVWWYIPSVGVYRYNYALNAWTGPCAAGYINPATTALWEAVDTDAQPIVLRGDASGYVTQTDVTGVYRDNVPAAGVGGTTFSMAVRCRRLYFDDPLQFKAFKWIYLQVWQKSSAQCAVTWLTANGSGQYTLPNNGVTLGEWGTGTWGTGMWGAGAQKPERVPINGTGPYVDILLTDGGDAQSVWSRAEVDGFDYGRRY